MDDPSRRASVTDAYLVPLFGTTRGKLVAALAHGYALTVFKLALAPSTVNAPWRTTTLPQDYFTWRRSMVAEQKEQDQTLMLLFDPLPIPEPTVIPWPLVNGKTIYDLGLAEHEARAYGKRVARALGLLSEVAKS